MNTTERSGDLVVIAESAGGVGSNIPARRKNFRTGRAILYEFLYACVPISPDLTDLRWPEG